MTKNHHRSTVIDFNLEGESFVADEEPEPADHEDYMQLRHAAHAVLAIVSAGAEQVEHLVELGQTTHLHLFRSTDDGFGVYNKHPGDESDMRRRAPLATVGMYLRVPRADREDNDGYIAGFGVRKVSRRSVQRVIMLCRDFVEARSEQEVVATTDNETRTVSMVG